MGYESRLYIVVKSDTNFNPETNFLFAEVIAEFNMCKFPELYSLFIKEGIKTNCAFYRGDDEITEDMYGEPLRELSVEKVIDGLNKIIASYGNKSFYWRLPPLLAMLEKFSESQDIYHPLTVLHFGY